MLGQVLMLVGIFGCPASLVVSCAACGTAHGGLTVEAWLAAGIFFVVGMIGAALAVLGGDRK